MGYETLQEIIDFNKNQATQIEPLTECPYDAWPLDVNSKGEKSCPICERIFR